MTAATKKVVTIAALSCLSFVGGIGVGQESSQSDAGSQQAAAVDEEVIVRGRNRAALREQIERAEEAVYARFNEINSRDEFDIFCRRELFTGSNIPRRICMPVFWREAQTDAGEETVRALQGSSAFSPQLFQGEALYKHQLLAEEMRRLAAEDEQLRDELVRMTALREALAERPPPLPSSASSSMHQATDGEEALPYEAALVADVRIGRERRWNHDLTRRTFTIAHVYGEVRAIDVECDERSERLRYEAGVEWTLPDDWGACTVLVEAAPSTTFSLYEFE